MYRPLLDRGGCPGVFVRAGGVHTSPEPRGTPHVDRQTPVKILTYPELRLRVVIMQNKTIDGTITSLITARKRSLRRLCFHRCVSVHGGVCLSACWDTTPLAKETSQGAPCQGDLLLRRPPAKDTPQVHTQGGN